MHTALRYVNDHSRNDDFLDLLEEHGMVGEELQYKRNNLSFFFDLFLNRSMNDVQNGWAFARKIVNLLLKIINSILESLGFIPGAGAAKEIKDHVHAGLSADVEF
jgi:hypothetical protein